MVQLSYPYTTTGKTIALTRWTFVGKAISLLLNMLSRLVITFLPRSKRLLISWLQSPSAVILEPKEIRSDTVSTVSPSISHFHNVWYYIGPRLRQNFLEWLSHNRLGGARRGCVSTGLDGGILCRARVIMWSAVCHLCFLSCFALTHTSLFFAGGPHPQGYLLPLLAPDQNQFETESEVAQSCPAHCHPMECNLPGSSVYGIF